MQTVHTIHTFPLGKLFSRFVGRIGVFGYNTNTIRLQYVFLTTTDRTGHPCLALGPEAGPWNLEYPQLECTDCAQPATVWWLIQGSASALTKALAFRCHCIRPTRVCLPASTCMRDAPCARRGLRPQPVSWQGIAGQRYRYAHLWQNPSERRAGEIPPQQQVGLRCGRLAPAVA